MNSIALNGSGALPILAGSVSDPGEQGGTWPVVYDQGLWELEWISGGGQGTSMGTGLAALFGINDYNIAVGYTPLNNSDTTPSAAWYSTQGRPSNTELIKGIQTVFPAESQSIAYGINDDGDMVGTATVTGVSESWYALCKSQCVTSGSNSASGKYTDWCWAQLSTGYSSATPTTAYGISDTVATTSGTKLVVGSYVEGAATYGFLVPVMITSSGTCQENTASFQQIVAQPQQNAGLSVVRGINDQSYIVGYYNSANKQYGFVGIPTTARMPRRDEPQRR